MIGTFRGIGRRAVDGIVIRMTKRTNSPNDELAVYVELGGYSRKCRRELIQRLTSGERVLSSWEEMNDKRIWSMPIRSESFLHAD